jgi:hypothetical protein
MATQESWRESTVTVVRGKELQLCLVTSRDLDLASQWCTIGRRTGINQSSDMRWKIKFVNYNVYYYGIA